MLGIEIGGMGRDGEGVLRGTEVGDSISIFDEPVSVL